MAKYTTLFDESSQLSMQRKEAIQARVSEIYFEKITRRIMEIIVRFINK